MSRAVLTYGGVSLSDGGPEVLAYGGGGCPSHVLHCGKFYTAEEQSPSSSGGVTLLWKEGWDIMLSENWPSEQMLTMEELQLELDALEEAGFIRREGEGYYPTELGAQCMDTGFAGAPKAC